MINFPRFFDRPQTDENPQDAILRDAKILLLETNEARFSKHLLARLLGEGCNLPLIIAKPRFYALMTMAFEKHLPPAKSVNVQEIPHDFQHPQFVEIMTMCYTHIPQAKQIAAPEVLNSIDLLKEEWQQEAQELQEEDARYEQRLKSILVQLYPQEINTENGIEHAVQGWLPQARRRIVIAMTTSLLRHVRDRQLLQESFGSLSHAIAAMQQNHAEFARFLRLCQERIPYYEYVAAQIFWRTLETLRLEFRNTPFFISPEKS
jgi:anti-sigma factor ChrR (cupin superfamily)